MMIHIQKLRIFSISAKTKAIIADIIAYLFILLFLYTAANKIWKFHNFEWVLSTLPLIGALSQLIAYAVPVAEIIASILLLSDGGRRSGLIISFLLMFGFTAYLLFMLIYTTDLPCNCGGVLSQLSWKQHIAFNLFFLILSTIALKFNQDIARAKQAKR
jgi:putative oxidoreductase